MDLSNNRRKYLARLVHGNQMEKDSEIKCIQRFASSFIM